MLFWTSNATTHKLGSSSQETLSKQENPCNKARCEGCIPKMPPQCGDSNSDMHPAPIQGLALMMLWLTFGGAPCPSEWGSIVESIWDLANAILLSDDRDPLSLQSLAQHLLLDKIVLADDAPFRIGRDLIVDIPVNPIGIEDLYIDAFVGLTVDINNNAVRLERAPLLAVGYTAQEVSEVEPLPCDDMEAWPKLIAETGLTE